MPSFVSTTSAWWVNTPNVDAIGRDMWSPACNASGERMMLYVDILNKKKTIAHLTVANYTLNEKGTALILSVQCYAWTEYKFTWVCVCVCVCVCVSVTLSVNSPTCQTPQRIFTVGSLKDADLRKDVPFGGLDDE